MTPLSSDGGRRRRGRVTRAGRLDGDAADDDGAGVSGVSQAVRKRARVWPASRESRACTAARGGPRHRPRLAAAGRICAIAAAPPSDGTTELVTWQQIRSCSYQNQCKPSMTPKSATCLLHPGGSARAARGPKFQWPSASLDVVWTSESGTHCRTDDKMASGHKNRARARQPHAAHSSQRTSARFCDPPAPPCCAPAPTLSAHVPRRTHSRQPWTRSWACA